MRLRDELEIQERRRMERLQALEIEKRQALVALGWCMMKAVILEELACGPVADS